MESEATQYALRVALQTMKERCQVLQKRVSTLEDENQKMRAGCKDDIKSTSTFANTASVGFAAENFQLRLQLAELERQKSQLTEQINMVSTENRKLWSRLSRIAKDQDGKNESEKDNICTLINDKSEQMRSGANQNLIRSKTFTQHSPNPNLRHKFVLNEHSAIGNIKNDLKDFSLEEVALNTDAGEEMATVTDAEIGFSYLNIEENVNGDTNNTNTNEADFPLEAKKCTDGLEELRREVLQQQQDLQHALVALQRRVAKHPCPDCAEKSKKPEMADKSLETDESLNEVFQAQQNDANIVLAHKNEAAGFAAPPLNIIQEKIEADSKLKICPMCGKSYNENVLFKDFCEHVETHFNAETSDFGSMMENDFEYISNTIGNF